jgi:hypothetical protein
MTKKKKNKPNVNRKVKFSGSIRNLPGISHVLDKLDNVKQFSNHPTTVKQRKEDLKIIPNKSPNGTSINDSLNNKKKRGRRKENATFFNVPLV